MGTQIIKTDRKRSAANTYVYRHRPYEAAPAPSTRFIIHRKGHPPVATHTLTGLVSPDELANIETVKTPAGNTIVHVTIGAAEHARELELA